MEEKVLEIIKNHNKALTYEEIMNELDDKNASSLSKALMSLQNNLKIRVTNKGKYEPFNEKTKKKGVFVANPKGFGFVVVEGSDKDYYVSAAHVKGAINGDEVVINVINEVNHEAAVERILQRNLNDLQVGEFYVRDNKNFVKLDDDKLNIILAENTA